MMGLRLPLSEMCLHMSYLIPVTINEDIVRSVSQFL